jgi:hypothetical protein
VPSRVRFATDSRWWKPDSNLYGSLERSFDRRRTSY